MQVTFHEVSWVIRGVSNIKFSFYNSTGPDARCILWMRPGEYALSEEYHLRLGHPEHKMSAFEEQSQRYSRCGVSKIPIKFT